MIGNPVVTLPHTTVDTVKMCFFPAKQVELNFFEKNLQNLSLKPPLLMRARSLRAFSVTSMTLDF